MILETTGNNMDSEKLIKRFRIVILNTLANMSAPVANMVCSWLVIRWISPELWGSYTKIFLLLMLALQITGFGSKEFLLREFSKSPKDIFNHWFSSLRSRFLLVIGGIILFVFFPFENDLKITLICCFSKKKSESRCCWKVWLWFSSDSCSGSDLKIQVYCG